MAEEESKFGTRTEDAIELVLQIAKLPGIHIKGLMTIAPYVPGIFKRNSQVPCQRKNLIPFGNCKPYFCRQMVDSRLAEALAQNHPVLNIRQEKGGTFLGIVCSQKPLEAAKCGGNLGGSIPVLF